MERRISFKNMNRSAVFLNLKILLKYCIILSPLIKPTINKKKKKKKTKTPNANYLHFLDSRTYV
jgi:hypothetical protein